MVIKIELDRSYNVVMEQGALKELGRYIDTGRKALVVSDTGVPYTYIDLVMMQLPLGRFITVEQGEQSKSLEVYGRLCETLLDNGFHRDGMVIALGGGVVGDLAGFAAATYMRGIDFINIPTTSLSQIDSSIGGKTAINLGGTKNIVGAFHQPSVVVVDTALLSTLPDRQFNNGLVEALKAGLIYDKTLYGLFAEGDVRENTDEIIKRAILVKKDVVEKDEKEHNLRKILNFGHTIGHGLESVLGLPHGEAVAAGMLPMIEDTGLRSEVKRILKEKLNINTKINFDKELVMREIVKDKKSCGGAIAVVKVKTVGQALLHRASPEECRKYLEETGV